MSSSIFTGNTLKGRGSLLQECEGCGEFIATILDVYRGMLIYSLPEQNINEYTKCTVSRESGILLY